jgi:hypothetical protein
LSTVLAITKEVVENKIYHIRGKKVMIDRDLAELYGVEIRRLNEQVRRNIKRFPADFMFQLTQVELDDWMSQFATSNREKMGIRKLPLVFTEQGVAMLSSVLNSDTAIEVNIQIIRIFTELREAVLMNKDILIKIQDLEKTLDLVDEKTEQHDADIRAIFRALQELLQPSTVKPKRIGFPLSGGE